MTPQARIHRMGWFALLAICTALYGVLHFQVWSLSSEVTKKERQIVRLQERNTLLETEFLTRSSQAQLAAWNRVDFGYSAPEADQFIENERQLARFGSVRGIDTPEPIRVAGVASDEDRTPFPALVSPITGKPLDTALIEPQRTDDGSAQTIVTSLAQRTARVPLSAVSDSGSSSRGSAVATTVRVSLGGAGQ